MDDTLIMMGSVQGVLDLTLTDHYPISYVGVYLAVFSGMRKGELAGLTWADIDWNAKILRVRRARQRLKRQEIVGDPKAKSKRDLTVSDEVMRVLGDWHLQHQEHATANNQLWNENSYVLCHLTGELYDPGLSCTIYERRKWRWTCHAFPCTTYAIHTLRYSWSRASTSPQSADASVTPPSRSPQTLMYTSRNACTGRLLISSMRHSESLQENILTEIRRLANLAGSTITRKARNTGLF